MKTYKVKNGDTLGTIAFNQLGSAGKWREIAELNHLINPNKIEVGEVLQLPSIAEPETSTQKSDVIIIEEDNKVYYHYRSLS